MENPWIIHKISNQLKILLTVFVLCEIQISIGLNNKTYEFSVVRKKNISNDIVWDKMHTYNYILIFSLIN